MTRHIHRALHALLEVDDRFMSDEEIRTLAALLTLYNHSILYMDERQAAQMTDCFCHELDYITCGQHRYVLASLLKVKDIPVLKPLSQEIEDALCDPEYPDYFSRFCGNDYYDNWRDWATKKLTHDQFKGWYWYFCSRCPYLDCKCKKEAIERGKEST